MKTLLHEGSLLHRLVFLSLFKSFFLVFFTFFLNEITFFFIITITPNSRSVFLLNFLFVFFTFVKKLTLNVKLSLMQNWPLVQNFLRAILFFREYLSSSKSVFVRLCPLVQFFPLVQICLRAIPTVCSRLLNLKT